MGAYYSDSLQIGINNNRADKAHSALFKVGRYRIGKRVGGFVCLVKYLTVRKAMQIIVKRAVLNRNRLKNLAVFYA